MLGQLYSYLERGEAGPLSHTIYKSELEMDHVYTEELRHRQLSGGSGQTFIAWIRQWLLSYDA